MRMQYRRRRLTRWAYWGLSLSTILAMVAWQYGWPPFAANRQQETPPGDTQDGYVDSGQNYPLMNEETINSGLETDPIIFENQSEPVLTAESFEGSRRQSVTGDRSVPRPFSSRQWDDPPAPPMPSEFTTDTGPAFNRYRTASSSREPATPSRHQTERTRNRYPEDTLTARPDGRGVIVQTASEVEVGHRESGVGDQASGIKNGIAPTPESRIPNPDPRIPTPESGPLPPEIAAIDRQLQAGQDVEAHRALSTLFWNKPELRDRINERLERTARSVYFDAQPHYMQPYVVRPGDRLSSIAARYKVPWQYLEKLNRIDARRIRPDQKLKVIKGPFSAVVDLDKFELIVHAHGYYVRRYRIGIGKQKSTPVGKYTVLNKVENPQYTDPQGRVVASDDPNNPLGERWIDLGDSYGIHGTIEPGSIGRAESRGCIRMYNPDVEEVYDLLTVGSEVLIRR